MTRPLPPHTLSVAPMMGWTDATFRGLVRRLTRHTLLVTEMVAPRAILHGELDRVLPVARHHPVAVQLGDDDPGRLAAAARVAVDRGYDEVDLNCGCPSDRATDGSFGACLMLRPDAVARAVAAMRATVDVPVTVKCRTGVDHHDGYDGLRRFADSVTDAGAARVTVHARKAWLDGLSTSQNRSVPPLRHDLVHRLKRERPDLVVVLNGGLATLEQAAAQLDHVDGAMIGRAATADPYLFARADAAVFGDRSWAPPSRADLVADVADELARRAGADGVLDAVGVGRLLEVFHGCRGARRWRRELSELRSGPGVTRADVDRLLERVDGGRLAA
jgi:tRNA-dihydrouridine synthase A